MATDMKWSTLELQLENLIPGILLLSEIATLFPYLASAMEHMFSAFSAGSIFIAASYAAGLVSALCSRILLDAWSENGVRAWVFGSFVHNDCGTLVAYFMKNDPKFEQDIEFELRKRGRKKDGVAQWNAIYRSALRTTSRRDEVDRRRAQGRVTRNLFFPIILSPILFWRIIVDSEWIAVLLAVPSVLVTAFLAVALYAYAELINMAEAHDISHIEVYNIISLNENGSHNN